ncbi:hypothetical protein EZV62_009614 [Acer yangbiense]|uniref:Uncharacterized protein n=1 Tax=Acer yangbiense TaxID=1000413 RepID=A0A5C7I0E6_9ROSI|nr:hypothetical protein EZV62_009614 [Acer yangbiense]
MDIVAQCLLFFATDFLGNIIETIVRKNGYRELIRMDIMAQWLLYFATDFLGNVIETIMRKDGYLSLVSIFLPHSLGFFIFIPWSLVPIIVAYQPIHAVFINIRDARLRLDQQMIMDFISKFSVIWTWFTQSDSREQEPPRVSP